jgi:FtsP/CotA-like multicopper oxidase with cupredoxin domain
LPVTLRAAPGTVDLGPLGAWSTWLYDGTYPGPELRVREGNAFRLTLVNALPEETSVHWHGVPVPNTMDGVAGITQPAVPAGGEFVYEWTARPPGTYLYHSHVGMQSDRGLVGALVIEETTPHVAYDRDVVVLVDDWLAGTPTMPMSGGMMGGGSGMPRYGAHLVSGRPPTAPRLLEVARGERVRLRLVNGGGATSYRVAMAGHRLTVTHTDGRAVRPVTVDALVLGPGERYDVVIPMSNVGVWNLSFDGLEDGLTPARLVVRYRESRASMPSATTLPAGLTSGRVLALADLVNVEGWPAPSAPARTFPLDLGGGMMGSPWTLGGQAYPNADPLDVPLGAWARITMVNRTMARHPMHLHGHFFRVGTAIKDTVLVPAGGMMGSGAIALDFLADNPGPWFYHCHNVYHMEAGMARVIRVG